jgi:hypothetical protein
MIQPYDFPERMMAAVPAAWYMLTSVHSAMRFAGWGVKHALLTGLFGCIEGYGETRL